MSDQDNNFNFADSVLGDLFGPQKIDLREVYEKRIAELDMSQRAVQDELGIEYRPLIRILDGTQKMVDLFIISKLANFLQIPTDKVFVALLEKLEQNFKGTLADTNKQDFIKKNFDLAKLKKSGFIDNINDFNHIEARLVEYFGLKSIYDYGDDFINYTYSSGKPKPKNNLMRNFWGESAAKKLKWINNPYDYDRDGLLEYIPDIRWHSTDVRNGLYQVIRELYTHGVTVIYEAYLPTIYVRGATIPINNKPCIILTDYTDSYATFWFSLMHELSHVLFDWDEIRLNEPHFSGEIDRFDKQEVEADEFAREYLFSRDKMNVVSPQIGNKTFVEQYAKAFDIHPSIIYSFYCWDNIDSGEDVYKRYSKYLIKAKEALAAYDPELTFSESLPKRTPVTTKSKQLIKTAFNGL